MLLSIFPITSLTAPVASPTKLSANETLSITLQDREIESYEIRISQVEPEIIHYLLTLSPTKYAIFQTVNGANLLIGNIFKFLLFKNVWSDGKLTKPINVMTGTFRALL